MEHKYCTYRKKWPHERVDTCICEKCAKKVNSHIRGYKVAEIFDITIELTTCQICGANYAEGKWVKASKRSVPKEPLKSEFEYKLAKKTLERLLDKEVVEQLDEDETTSVDELIEQVDYYEKMHYPV